LNATLSRSLRPVLCRTFCDCCHEEGGCILIECESCSCKQ
jgi:hypothetical protein